MEPPKWQSWTVGDGFLGALAIVAACLAAYGVSQITGTPWIIFVVFAATLALLLAGIVNGQTKRHARHEEEYADWLQRRVGGLRKK
jgi:uncharacterized membrane protein